MPASITYPPPRDHRKLRAKRYFASRTFRKGDEAPQVTTSSSSTSSSSSSASPEASVPPIEDDYAFENISVASVATKDRDKDKNKDAGSDSGSSDRWRDLVVSLLPEEYVRAWVESEEKQKADDCGEEDRQSHADDDATAFASVASKTDFANLWKNLPTIMKIENYKKEEIESREKEEEKAKDEAILSNLIISCPSETNGEAPLVQPVPKVIAKEKWSKTNREKEKGEERLKECHDRQEDDFSVDSLLSLHQIQLLEGGYATETESLDRSVARSTGRSLDERSLDSLLSFYRMHRDDFSATGGQSVARSIARSTARSMARSTARSVKSLDTLRQFYRMLEDDGSATLGRSVALSAARSIGRSTIADDETSIGSFVSALTTDDLSVDFDTAFVPLRDHHAFFFPTIEEFPSDEEKSDDEEEEEDEIVGVRGNPDHEEYHEDDDVKSEAILDDNFCSMDSILDAWDLPQSAILFANAASKSSYFCGSATQSCLPPPPEDLLPEALIPSEGTFEKVRSIISV